MYLCIVHIYMVSSVSSMLVFGVPTSIYKGLFEVMCLKMSLKSLSLVSCLQWCKNCKLLRRLNFGNMLDGLWVGTAMFGDKGCQYSSLGDWVLWTKRCNEIYILQDEAWKVGQVRHERLVNLIGFCAEGDERLLVAEYMPHDTLAKHLFHCKQSPLHKSFVPFQQ